MRNAVAIAEADRRCEVRYLGEVDASEAATRKLVGKLAAKYKRLSFCYEAGPTGSGLYRLITSLGHECQVDRCRQRVDQLLDLGHQSELIGALHQEGVHGAGNADSFSTSMLSAFAPFRGRLSAKARLNFRFG